MSISTVHLEVLRTRSPDFQSQVSDAPDIKSLTMCHWERIIAQDSSVKTYKAVENCQALSFGKLTKVIDGIVVEVRTQVLDQPWRLIDSIVVEVHDVRN